MTIKIEAYNENWPTEFNNLKDILGNLLGPLALRIDHIGSTSIPGLGAKDIIDIQVTVTELTPQLKLLFEGAGFEFNPNAADHVPNGMDPSLQNWEKFLFSSPSWLRRAHIHVRLNKSLNQRYALLFRDYLREHPKIIPILENIKRQLAALTEDIEEYLSVKDPIYDIILIAAEEWSERTKWYPL